MLDCAYIVAYLQPLDHFVFLGEVSHCGGELQCLSGLDRRQWLAWVACEAVRHMHPIPVVFDRYLYPSFLHAVGTPGKKRHSGISACDDRTRVALRVEVCPA